MSNKTKIQRDHMVIFPFLAKGHTIPLLHFAAALSRHQPSLRITIITTPSNAPFIRRHSPDDVGLVIIPFPNCPSLPPGCESTDSLPSFDLFPPFVAATTLLCQPFESVLHALTPTPLCVISDFFFGWTLPICDRLHIPRIVFHGMSAFSMAVCKSLWVHLPNLHVDSGEPFHLPGTPQDLLLTKKEIPVSVLKSSDLNDPGTRFISEIGDADINSWAVLVNSFVDVEGEYVELFESFYKNGARACLVGPLCLYANDEEEIVNNKCIRWLDEQATRSVIYVSFGTQADVPDEQLDEVANGLAESGYKFLWALRSLNDTWAPPEGLTRNGKVVKWAPQREVLNHRATGGFLTHCGWNSVMEGVSAGVPMLAWPMIAEQHLNAKMVVEELMVGLRLLTGGADDGALVRRERVKEGLRELMKGDGVRERVALMSERAKRAVGEGGSSRRRLEELIKELQEYRSEREAQAGAVSNDFADGSNIEYREEIQIV